MVLEPQGFVARIAEDLERTISQGKLPKDGSLPSEQRLAKSYGVSRSTVREALKHLAARGVVVQHPGRRNRAARLDVAITLENLSVALHAIGPAHPERLRLLEGYLSLKRETAVEVLAACCEHASQRELDPVIDACFALAEGTRWEPETRRWAELEFELLRLAACMAARPGHFLLVQSLEKSFWGMAGKLTPHLDSQATYSWAMCAFHALRERDAQAVRRDLPSLLKACDEQLLRSLTSPHEPHDTSGAPAHSQETRVDELPEPSPASSDESPASQSLRVRGEPPSVEISSREESLSSAPPPEAETFNFDAVPTLSLAFPVLSAEFSCEENAALEHALSGEPAASATAPPDGATPESTVALRGLPGAVCANRSACPTGACQTRPTGGAPQGGAGGDWPCCDPPAS